MKYKYLMPTYSIPVLVKHSNLLSESSLIDKWLTFLDHHLCRTTLLVPVGYEYERCKML